MKKIGMIGCSDGLSSEKREQIGRLKAYLESCSYETASAKYLFEAERTYPGNGRLRAAELMKLWEDPNITDIFDVSGGNQANEVLADLDYDRIGQSSALFWGYSDLTTVLNAVYTKTGKLSMLYQGRFLVGELAELQQRRFEQWLKQNRGGAEKRTQYSSGGTALTELNVTHVQGGPAEGILIGGNIRCFLKLAGTEYFPDLTDKILLLEAWSGQLPQILTYLNQLKQLGAFSRVSGILLGTFTEMEQKMITPDIKELVKDLAGGELPVYATTEIGHGHDAKAAVIGGYYRLRP